MSTTFFGRLATGVALGSAALLISAPGAAYADEKAEPKHDQKHEAAEAAKTDSGIKQSEKSALNTAQKNESHNKVIAKAEKTAVAVNVPIQINLNAGFPYLGALSDGSWTCTNGVSSETLESASEITSLAEAADFLQLLDNECNGDMAGSKGKGKDAKGPKNVNSVIPVGDVAAGDGGALATTGAGGMAAAGIGMLGVAALGGTALLRRRTADDSVA